MPQLIISTSRKGLVLKQLIPSDAPHYFALIESNRTHLSQHDDDTARKYPTEVSVLESIINPPNPKKIRFGIWDGDTLVGMVGLTPRGRGTCETGGWTGVQFTRSGYAAISRRTVAQYAHQKLGYLRVIATTHPNNTASQGMLVKAGYTLVRRTNRSHHFAFTT